MSVLLTKSFHSELANRILTDIQHQKVNYYYFLGKVDSWSPTSEVPPSTISETGLEERSIRSEIINLKKIQPNDVSFCTDRHNWESGTVYSMWDHTKDMSLTDTPFFVMTTDYNVYKCIDNGSTFSKPSGEPSTVMPAGTSTSPVKLADNYIWKYMYTVPVIKRKRFISPDKLPVQISISDRFYNNGSIEDAVVLSGGTLYPDHSTVQIEVIPFSGDTPSIPAELVPVVSSAGKLIHVKVANPGEGYTHPPTLNIISLLGSGASVSPIVVGSKIVSVKVNDQGSNYQSGNITSLTVTGDGHDASLIPVIYNGSIIDVVIENPGEGYTSVSVEVSASNGSGTLASISAILADADLLSGQSMIEQTAIDGAIHKIVIVKAGKDYVQQPIVTIEGDGDGCTAIANLSNGSVESIDIISPGSGYTWANVVVTAHPNDVGNVTPTAARAILPPLGGHGKDAVAELFADTICMYSIIKSDSLVTTQQDYRQFGIIANPRDTINRSTINGDTADALYILSFDNVVDLEKDKTLSYDGVKYRIIEVTGSKVYLSPLSKKVLNVGNALVSDTGSTYTITNIESYPLLDKFSGKLLCVADETAFTYSNDQSIILKSYIKL